jgi:hypothetical protein
LERDPLTASYGQISPPLPRQREREFWTWAAAIVVYAATAIADFVLPLGRHFGERLLGTAVFAQDAILNAGILEWGYRSLWSSSRHVFEWTGGFPLHDSLAATENLIGWQLFYTPLRQLGAGPVAAYNILIVISFVLSGLGAALFARRFGIDRWGAIVAGFIFAFVPFHLNHAIHIQTMAVCYCPFALYFLDRFLSEAAIRDALGLAVACLMTALSGVYFGLFLLLVLPLYAVLCWVSGRHRFRFRTLEGLLGVGLACAFVLLPVVLAYMRFGSENGHHHTEEGTTSLSLEVLAPFKVPRWLAFWSPLRREDWTPAFPGAVASLLALWFLLKRNPDRQTRQAKILLVLLGFVIYVLSLGPVLKLHAYVSAGLPGWIPLPGKIFLLVPSIRWPMRILLFSFLFGGVLAGLGFSKLTQRFTPALRLAVASLTIILLFLEYRPQSWYAADSCRLPSPLSLSDAYPFLAAEADRGGVIELPDRGPDGSGGYRVRYAYGSAGHLRRIVAFHGKDGPPILDNLLAAAERLPSEPSRRFLAASGVTRLVVHRGPNFIDSRAFRRDELVRAGYAVVAEMKDATIFALETSSQAVASRAR